MKLCIVTKTESLLSFQPSSESLICCTQECFWRRVPRSDRLMGGKATRTPATLPFDSFRPISLRFLCVWMFDDIYFISLTWPVINFKTRPLTFWNTRFFRAAIICHPLACGQECQEFWCPNLDPIRYRRGASLPNWTTAEQHLDPDPKKVGIWWYL